MNNKITVEKKMNEIINKKTNDTNIYMDIINIPSTMDENIVIKITEEVDISKMSKTELLERCKELGITKCASKTKAEIKELIENKVESNKKMSTVLFKIKRCFLKIVITNIIINCLVVM